MLLCLGDYLTLGNEVKLDDGSIYLDQSGSPEGINLCDCEGWQVLNV